MRSVVDDPERTRFLADHLAVAAQAIDEGIPLTGFYAWSLLDNYEWAEGYAQRFGIVHVDYPTQRRIVKRSGRLYQAVAQAHRSARELARTERSARGYMTLGVRYALQHPKPG